MKEKDFKLLEEFLSYGYYFLMDRCVSNEERDGAWDEYREARRIVGKLKMTNDKFYSDKTSIL